jgi:hypothetical protein
MRRPAVAAADDGDELARVLVVVVGGELGERLLRRAAAEERDDVLAVAPAGVLADRLTQPDPHGAFGARGAHEHAVGRVTVASLGH